MVVNQIIDKIGGGEARRVPIVMLRHHECCLHTKVNIWRS